MFINGKMNLLLAIVTITSLVIDCPKMYGQHKNSIILLTDTSSSNSITKKTIQLRTLEINSVRTNSALKSRSTGLYIDVAELKKIPNILGDADPFKALQYIGGISQAGEANAGLYVRGGNNDQNLILFNSSYIQQPNHVLGLFSIFNPDLIEQMRFIKSGIPAEYGSKLSSVIEVRNKQNTNDSLSVKGSVGLIASRLAAFIPITKKLSINTSLRASYIGAVVMPALTLTGVDKMLTHNSFEFYDVGTDVIYKISQQSRLQLYGYKGNDRMQLAPVSNYSLQDNSSNWGSETAGVKLQNTLNASTSMTNTLNFTGFNLAAKFNWLNTNYLLSTEYQHFNFKNEVLKLINQHQLKYGLEYSDYTLFPTNIGLNELANVEPKHTHLTSVFVRDEFEIGKFLFNMGLRSEYYWFDNKLESKKSTNFFVEPRFFTRYLINNHSSAKVSVSRLHQFNFQLPVINFGIPLDIQLSANEKFRPQGSWHYSMGYFAETKKRKFDFNAEIYYKSLTNQLEFNGDIMQIVAGAPIEGAVKQGKGEAYGLEGKLSKNRGFFSGWINYHLSWNKRTFDEINNGKWFYAKQDRRHDFSAVLIMQPTNRLSISAVFSYATGSRLNLPRSWYIIDNKLVFEYEKFNRFVMPAYHRLDISANYKLKSTKRLKSELNFSIYNIYNRANPFQVYFGTNKKDGRFTYDLRMSYLLPILPALSWTFQF